MKILYHHRTRSRDGQRVHIDGLVGALRRAGSEVRVVGPQVEDSGGASRARSVPGFLRPARELAERAYNRLEVRQLRRAVADWEPGAVYSRHALFCDAPGRVARRLGVPWIVEVNAPLARERAHHGGLFFEGWARRLETRTLNAAGRVVVVTRVMGDMLVEQGVREGQIDVHPNGVDPSMLEERPPDRELRRRLNLEGCTVLGFVGFVRDWNRLERVYPFLKRVPNAVFLVVGDGPDRPRLEAEARSAAVFSQVRFAGVVPREEVRAYVDQFDVALLPETPPYASPLKLLDYLAAGKVVLAPDRANLREVLEHERNGLLFEPDSDADFEAKLDAVLRSLPQRARLQREARATIERLGLTWDQNAQRVIESFQRLRGLPGAES